MDKEAVLCSAGPFKRTEIKKYEHLFTTAPDVLEGDRVLVIDCSSPDRTGDLEPLLKGLPRAVIDHHETNEYSRTRNSANTSEPVFLDGKAPSTTFLVLKLIDTLGLEPNREEAEMLFFGLCTDTGFFRHVDAGGAEIFRVAARLIQYGANPKAAFAAIHGGKSLDSRKLLGIVLTRAETFFDGQLVLSVEEYEETCQYGIEGRDTDSLYQLFQSIEGIEAIVLIRQETPDYCTVGFRSRDQIDVAKIAQSFGGGGHKNASGLRIAGTIGPLKQEIIEAFSKVFNPLEKK